MTDPNTVKSVLLNPISFFTCTRRLPELCINFDCCRRKDAQPRSHSGPPSTGVHVTRYRLQVSGASPTPNSCRLP
jgi:hypothetical protein